MEMVFIDFYSLPSWLSLRRVIASPRWCRLHNVALVCMAMLPLADQVPSSRTNGPTSRPPRAEDRCSIARLHEGGQSIRQSPGRNAATFWYDVHRFEARLGPRRPDQLNAAEIPRRQRYAS